MIIKLKIILREKLKPKSCICIAKRLERRFGSYQTTVNLEVKENCCFKFKTFQVCLN